MSVVVRRMAEDAEVAKAPGITQWIPLPYGAFRTFLRDPLAFQLDARERFGDVFRFWVGPLLVHFQHDRDPQHVAIVRISSREFVTNPQPPDLAAIVDIDVFTPASFSSADPNAAKAWLGRAHELEKEEFFRLIPDDIVEKLTEGKG